MLMCCCCGVVYDKKNKKEDRVIYGCISCGKGWKSNHTLTSCMPKSHHVYSSGTKRGKSVNWKGKVWVKM